MEEKAKKGFYFDPSCECDAPTYVDFAVLADQYDDNADEWFDTRTEEQDPAFESESPPEDGKESPPKVGKLQSAANALAQMIANGTGSISKLKPRTLPRKAAQSKPAGPMRSLGRARVLKKEEPSDTDKKCNDPVVNFAKSLRSDYSKTPATRRRIKPFIFECDKRAALRSGSKAESSKNSYQSHVSTAEFVAKFQTTTPPRFRRTPRLQSAGKGKQLEKEEQRYLGCHMTVPKTPVLHTRNRTRPVTVKGAKEIEDEELAAMKENQFKAKPFDRKIIDKDGLYGVPRKRSIHTLTEAHTPNFSSKDLPKKRRTVQETDGNSSSQFQANPMPDFSKVKGVPSKRPHPVTVPESPVVVKRPRIAGSSRQQDKGETSCPVAKPNEVFAFSAQPMPDFSKTGLPPRSVSSPVKPMLFQLRTNIAAKFKREVNMYPENKGVPSKRPHPLTVPESPAMMKRSRTADSSRQQDKGDDEVFVFSARPMPEFSKTGLPPRAVSSPVEPMTFQLRTDIRGEKYAATFKQEVEEKKQQEKLQREFRAKKNVSSVLYGKPFEPEKSQRPALCVDNFMLRTELRSQERSKFDSLKLRRSCLLEASNLERKALRETEEAKEIAEYRKTLVHKPLPIGGYPC